MQSQGWTLVDVRIAGDYDALHAAGAINIPLFRFVQGNSFW
jgi:rhodanese-related sulfurtransferase